MPSDQELLIWLALHRIPQLGNRTLLALIKATQNPREIFELDRHTLDTLGVSRDIQRALASLRHAGTVGLQRQCLSDWQTLQRNDIHILPLTSSRYPELLKQIVDPPALLYARGNLDLLDSPQLAMVGSRRVSRQGRENAYRFARELAGVGFTVTSGLALGVDVESHRGALSVAGNTIAILGTGLDIIYPRRNARDFEQIAMQGLLLSEFPLGSQPRPHRFPMRNRIISGLSLGVLVVEAAMQSGSLITARLALEHNREVFVIPGSIHSSAARGCNELIRQGATLVENIDQIMEELKGWIPQQDITVESEQALTVAVGLRESTLLQLIGFDPTHIDTIHSDSGWSIEELTSVLTALEVKGLIENQGGRYCRLGPQLTR